VKRSGWNFLGHDRSVWEQDATSVWEDFEDIINAVRESMRPTLGDRLWRTAITLAAIALMLFVLFVASGVVYTKILKWLEWL